MLGGELRLTIAASNYGSFGQVAETLPEGFTFVSSSLEDAQTEVEGQTGSRQPQRPGKGSAGSGKSDGCPPRAKDSRRLASRMNKEERGTDMRLFAEYPKEVDSNLRWGVVTLLEIVEEVIYEPPALEGGESDFDEAWARIVRAWKRRDRRVEEEAAADAMRAGVRT